MDHIVSVLGPVPAEDMSITLPHEHIFIDLTREFRVGGLLNDADIARSEVEAFKAVGGGTIIDVTANGVLAGATLDPGGSLNELSGSLNELGGKPDAANEANVGDHTQNNRLQQLQDIASSTGVHVVVSTGHYRDPYLDRDWFDRNNPDAIAEGLIRNIREGFPGTDIHAGIIGEIGSDKWYISTAEERSFRAAARAHHATGLTITTHAARWPVGLPQLDLLVSEGVRPQSVIIGHCDQINSHDYHAELARRGAWVQFDCIRGNNQHQTELRLSYITRMVAAGWVGNLLLSHDVCRTEHLQAYGGHGYTYVPTTFSDLLREAGVSQHHIDQMLITNPRQALTARDSD